VSVTQLVTITSTRSGFVINFHHLQPNAPDSTHLLLKQRAVLPVGPLTQYSRVLLEKPIVMHYSTCIKHEVLVPRSARWIRSTPLQSVYVALGIINT
jgi:hypothetical protein